MEPKVCTGTNASVSWDKSCEKCCFSYCSSKWRQCLLYKPDHRLCTPLKQANEPAFKRSNDVNSADIRNALIKARRDKHTAISRKVVGKNVHATTPKGNMGYDQYSVPHDWSCRTYFCCFPLALANICPLPLVPSFQISLENGADKTTHNTFRDCRVHFFRQPFSKQLYIVAVARLRHETS